MGVRFWIKRFFLVAAGAFLVLLLVERLKSHGWHAAFAFSSFWALATATVFIGTRMYYASRGVACPMCKDLPEER